jgi:hypothetical protein
MFFQQLPLCEVGASLRFGQRGMPAGVGNDERVTV